MRAPNCLPLFQVFDGAGEAFVGHAQHFGGQHHAPPVQRGVQRGPGLAAGAQQGAFVQGHAVQLHAGKVARIGRVQPRHRHALRIRRHGKDADAPLAAQLRHHQQQVAAGPVGDEGLAAGQHPAAALPLRRGGPALGIVAALLFQRQRRHQPALGQQPQPLQLALARRAQQAGAQGGGGQQRRGREVPPGLPGQHPQPAQAKVQPAGLLRHQRSGHAQPRHLAPHLRRVAQLVAAVAQPAQVRHRHLVGKKRLGGALQVLLLLAEGQAVAGRHDDPAQSVGRPSTRRAMTFSCTSEVPPSIELALDRSQARVVSRSCSL